MEGKSDEITNDAPLKKLRNKMSELKNEISSMDERIGIYQSLLTTKQLKDTNK